MAIRCIIGNFSERSSFGAVLQGGGGGCHAKPYGDRFEGNEKRGTEERKKKQF